MQPEVRRYLYDIQRAAGLLDDFTASKTFADYSNDVLLRAETERQFEIIGEAVSRISSLDTTVASRMSEYPRIIAFRNFLIHQYDFVDNRVVWGVLQTKLPTLLLEVGALLEEE